MGKFIFWIVVFFLVLLALRMLSAHKAKRDAREDAESRERDIERNRRAGRDTRPGDDTMIRCSACGVYIPKKSSVLTARGASCGNASCERLKG